jgi:hypothetical protein
VRSLSLILSITFNNKGSKGRQTASGQKGAPDVKNKITMKNKTNIPATEYLPV